MTRKRSSPLGLELVVSAMLIFMLLPLLTQAAPLQDATEIQQYTEGCYYNYNHYNEGDRILTNEPCLNCTCHNKMLMCYLRVCPFTKPIGHDCTVEKREDQCCPIITCPEVPVDIAHHAPEPGTELSIPEKYGCSIEEKFYPEGAQVPSNPNKPCELCYCIKNRTSCLMQECTLHIDGCQPIYNKGSCCPVRYNCDHENDILELEDQSTSTTTTVRPTPGFVLTTTMSSAVSTDCIHNGERHADGSSITGKSSCEHCYCMRGDIVCAVQECDMPMLDRNGKSCRPLPASEGQCCPSNYVCEDDSATTQIIEVTTQAFTKEQAEFATTSAPEKDLHGTVSQEDIKLQEHIDEDAQLSTEEPEKDGDIKPVADDEMGSGDFGTEAEVVVDHTTVSVIDKKHEVLPADTTLEPFFKIEDKIDQATESGIALDQTTVSAANADEETAFAVDHTTVLTYTKVEADKKHEEPTFATDHTTASADTTGKVDKKDEELMDHTTLPAATTGDLDKKHEEPAIDLDQTTVSADTTGELDKKYKEPTIAVEHTTVSAETDKSDEESAIDLDQTTVSADTTGEVDKKQEPVLTVPTDTTGESDKKDDAPASDLDHTTISTDAFGEVDKKDQKPANDFDQTTVSSETTDEIVKKHQEHVTAIDRTTISPESVVDHGKKQDAIPNVTEKVTDEVGITSVPAIEIVDRIDEATESGIAIDHPVTPADAFSEIEKKPDSQLTTTAEAITTAPSIGIEDKIDSTTDSDESSVSIEDEEIIPVTSAPVEVPKESVEETTEKEEFLTGKPDTTEELEKKYTIESATGKIPTSDGSAEGISGETTTDKVEMDEDQLEITTAKPKTGPQIDEEEISTEKISTLAGIPEKPVEITAIATDEKTVTPLAPSEISDKFGSTDGEVEESGASTLATPTRDEPKITSSTASGILDESEEETTSSDEKEVDLKATAKPFTAEELTTSATLSISSVQQDEKDKKEETTIGYYETTVSSDIFTSQTTEKPTERPAISEEVSSEKVFDMEKIPIVIPGEGDCLVGQKTYNNNSVVPNSDICEMSCRCISSVVVCQTVKCDIQNMEKCILDESNKGCCPTFICDGEKIDTTQFPIQTPTTTEGIKKEVSEKDIAATTPAKDVYETATFTPTDIDMPAASTEEPMSHVKDEVEEDQEHGTTSILKIDLLPIATETPSVLAQKPVSKPEDTIPHDKLEDKPVTEEQIAAHTVAPTLSEKPIEDVTEIDTTAPSAEIDEEEIIDETLSHTAAPSIEDENITETITPSDVDIEKEILSQTTTPATDIEKEDDKVTKTQTVAPAITEKDKVSGKEPLAPITETGDISHAEKEAEDVTEVGTLLPSIKDNEKEAVDESLAQTVIPPHDKTATAGVNDATTEAYTTPSSVKGDEEETLTYTVAPIAADEYETTKIQTVSPSVEDKETQTLDVHTVKPFIDGGKDAEDHTVKIEDSESDVISQTAAPGIELEKETDTMTSVHPLKDEDKESIDGTTPQYITPATETEEKDESLAHTITPIIEDGKPVQTNVAGSDEKAEEHIGASTVVPLVGDKKKESADEEKKPFDDSIAVTISPFEIDSIVPTIPSRDKVAGATETPSDKTEKQDTIKDEFAHTLSPSIEKETEDTTKAQTIAPSLTVEVKKPFDETLEHTIAPIVESEMDGEGVTKSTLPSVEDEESLSHTVAPASADKINIDDHTIAPSIETDKKEPVDETLAHTVTPIAQDEKQKEESTDGLGDNIKKLVEESTAHSITLAEEETESAEDVAKENFTVSSIKGQEQVTATKATTSTSTDESGGHTTDSSTEDHTDSILSGSDKGIDEATKTQTVTPISDEEKENELRDETLAHTIAPHVEKEETTEDVTKVHSPATLDEGKEKDEDHTDSPLSGSDKGIDEATKTQTVAPISSEEKETKVPSKQEEKEDEEHTDSTLSGSDKETEEATKTQTVAPTSDEEKETKAPSKQEEIEDEDHTDSILSGSDKGIDEATKTQTVAPISSEEKETKVPSKQEEKEDEEHTDSTLSGSDKETEEAIKTQTVAPISDEEKETKAPSKQEEIEDEDHTDSILTGSDKGIDEATKTQTVAPISSEEKETKVPSTQEEKEDEDHTDSTLSGSDKKIEEATKTQTVAPISDEEKETKAPSKQEEIEDEDHTDSILSGSDKGIDEATKTQTIAPISDEEKETKDSSKQEEIEDEVRAQTELPSTAAKENESGDKFLAHTIAPHVKEGETTEDVTKVHSSATLDKGKEKDEVHTETPSVLTEGEASIDAGLDSAHIDENKSDEDESEEDTHTAIPSVDDSDESSTEIDTPLEEDKHEQSVTPALESEEEAEAVTKGPAVEGGQKEPVHMQTTSIPVKNEMEDKEKETADRTSTPASVDEFLTHTIAPDEHFGYTSVPEVKKETEDVTKVPTAAPSVKNEDKKLDASLAHVSTPSTEYEKVTEAPLIQDDKTEGTTKSPDAPTAEDEGQETIDETLASTDVTTSESEEESEEDTKAHTLAPSVGTDEKQNIDESLAHTDSPVIVTEKITVVTTTKEDHTAIPSAEEETKVEDNIKDHTVSSIEDEEKTDKELQTITPEAEDRKDTEAQTSIPSIEVPEKKPIDESLAHTIVPSSEEESEELSKDHTVSPLIEDENKDFVKHTTVFATETEASTVAPFLKDDGKQPIDESTSHTISPIKGVEKEIGDISKTTTDIPSVGDKEKETVTIKIEDTKDTEDYTVSPVTEIDKQTTVSTIDDKEKKIIAPSIQDKHETEAHTIVPAVETSDNELYTVTPLVEKETVGITEAYTVAPVGQKEEEETDEIFSSTVATLVEGEKKTEDTTKSTAAPTIKEEETEFMAHTIAPIVQSKPETFAPSGELDESMAQTIAPTSEDEQELDNITKTPLDVIEKDEQQTISPIGGKKPLDETATPVSEIIKTEDAGEVPVKEEKVEEAHTVAPLGSEKESVVGVEDYTVSPLEEDKEKETDHAVTSSVEDESLPQSTVSTILGEKETEETTTVKGAQKDSIDVTSAHTVAPAIDGEKIESIEPSKEGEVKEPISQTTASAIESVKETEIVTAPSAEGEQSTRAPSVIPSLESVEVSEESVESEEELTTEGSSPKIQHIGEFVTERIEEAVTELPQKIDDTIKHDEVEESGEEGEDMEDIEVDVKKIISSSTPKPVEQTKTPSSIESEEDQTTSKDKDEITDSTQKPLEAVTTESVPLDVGIAVTTPEHKITEVLQTAEVQTEENVAEEVTLPPQTQDIPTKIHTGIEITEESATEKAESLEEGEEQKEGDEQKESDEHKSVTESSASEEDVEADTQATTTSHPLFGQHTSSTYLPPLLDERIDTTANVSETGKEPAALTTTTTTSAPTVQYPNAPSPVYGGQPPQYPSYPEDEYTDEDETEVFGPGTCRYGGKLFVSAQQIPRDDPCDFCFCFRSDIICLQQSCPPPISGCHEEPISGFCCPRYECPVSMATVLNITTSTTTTSTTLPPHFLHHAYQGAAEKNGCHINGKSYQVGEKIDSTSGPCMHCTCGGDGQMKCDPKTCSPEPMLRQMIASVASRRR